MPASTGRLSANAQCFGAMLLWAAGFVSLEFLLDDWGALSLIAVRLAVSAGFLVIWWLLIEGVKQATQAPWVKGLFIGALGWGLGSILLYLGQRLSDPVATTIVVAMMPIAGAAIEIVFDGRRLPPRLVAGIVMAVGGGYLATGVTFDQSAMRIGVALCIVAIFLFAWATRATTRQLETLSRTGQAAVTLVGGALIVVLLYLAALPALPGETTIGTINSARFWPFMIYLLPSCGIAQLMWIYGAGRLGVMLASFHMNAVPFYVMVILLTLSMGEWQWIRAAGVALVVLGVFVSQFHPGPGGAEKRKVTMTD
ncbi:MAG: DMT family transporter [Arenicellales bacterium]|nr:DMT family transporter [Arenicellales bacterium]